MRRLCFGAVLLCLVAGAYSQVITCNDVSFVLGQTTITLGGNLSISRNDEHFCSYTNIRYATPPIGDLRFHDPVALPSRFPAGLQAQLPEAYGPYICVQEFHTGIVGDEDCLVLNVFTKRTSANAGQVNLPVMVWIHGGMFKTGSANSGFHDPQYLLSQNIIVVTINYRLNVFGFLSFDNPQFGIPGNAGLKDQVLALRWIRENIRHFGGNPEQITLFGQGAGATSAHFHVLSPMSSGLFHRVILQSGTALNPTVGGLRDNGVMIARELSLNATNVERMLETLRTMSAEHLYFVQNRLLTDEPMAFGSIFGPVIERNITQQFLADDPFDLISRGEYNDVPMMIGYNDAEGIAFHLMLPTDLTLIVQNHLAITQANRLATVRQQIQNFYFPTLNMTNNETGRIYMFTDAWFGFPAVRTAALHAGASATNIYLYRFSGDTALNVFKRNSIWTRDFIGASHEDDIGYLFHTSLTPEIIPNTLEYSAIDRMITIWTSFAISPQAVPGDNTVNFVWTPIGPPTPNTSAIINYAAISTLVTAMSENPDRHRIDFWTDIYDRHFRRSSATIAKGFIILTLTLSLFNLVV
nr:esterase B1-like [Onthophagus taurus]